MDTYLDEKGIHQTEYQDKIRLLVERDKPVVTGKTVKIRVTKKKRPDKVKSDLPVPDNVKPESDKVNSETPVSDKVKSDLDTVQVKGRLNEDVVAWLDELSVFMVKRGEPFKSRAYQKAQESIVLYTHDITHENYKELSKLPGVGEAIIHKIEEYIKTGTLRILERERADPQNVFADIYGVGPKKAADLVSKGFKTIDELRGKQDEYLNSIQKVGLKYYDDILQRIPRSEIDDYHNVFSKTFESVKDTDSKYEIVGSYRRNAETSGDIDVIVTSENKEVFTRFIDSLLEQNIILEILSRGPTKSLVVAKLPGGKYARRVDFLYTSQEEYPFAVLYFTGSKVFNTVMRGRALSMGYSLNEHGLHKMDGKKKGGKVEKSFSSESDIFDFLQMKYKEPKDRKNGQSVVPIEGSPALVIPDEIENITVTVKEPSSNKTRKIRISADEKKANKEIARIEKERVKRVEQERKEVEKKAQQDNKEELKKRIREEKEGIKQKKRDDKTAKKREKETASKTAKLRKAVVIKEKLEKKIKTSGDTIKMKRIPKNKTVKNPVSDSACAICKISPVDLHSVDPILHAIQHYKTGGMSVLEQLNEKTLNAMLVKTNDVYRNLGQDETTLVTDNQYDILEDYIKQKYPKNTVVGKIGAPVAKNKVTLPYEMASMDKIKPDTKALSVSKSKYKGDYVVSCKLDGVSGLYTTENDTSKLYTRGDGKIGQDITHLIPHLKLPSEPNMVVRGEFIMRKTTFSTKYADKFANGRNLVAGTVNRLSINETAKDMDFVAYEVIQPSLTPSEQMKFLEEKGFNTVYNKTHKDVTNDKLSESLVDLRANYDYEIDGLIVTDDRIYPRSSGNPDHSIAFKMVLSDQMAETMVLDVEWNASKDGYLKPRVRIEPVRLSGVKIEYATGFNGSFIESNRIGVGALIQIIRSGDVIPYIREIITPADQGLMPTVPYIWNDTHVDIMLENKEDNKTVREKNITGFFKGISVDGMGEGNVTRIIDAGFDTVSKILRMSEDDFLTIDGFQAKMAKKLHVGIREKVEKASLITLMSSSNTLGRGFSGKKIELVMEEYPDILTSIEDNNAKIQKIANINGMASKTAQSFVENIPRFLGFMEECELMSKVRSPAPKSNVSVNTEHPLYKKSIVMSGNRDKELEDALKKLGVNLGSSVSKNTFALITPDTDSSTGKAASAKKHNVDIFTPDDFRNKYLK